MSALRNQYAIVEPMLTTISYDGIQFDCYGETDSDGPELRQIALHGTATDLFDLLDNKIIQNIASMLEWQWLQNKMQTSSVTAPLCFGTSSALIKINHRREQMDIATLEALGINKEDLQQRVVDQIVESLLTKTSVDDEDRAYYGESEFSRDLKVLVKTSIDKKVADLAEKFVLPDVEKYIEELTIQTTNQYGEKRGEPITFVEYLVHRAKDYMQEQVDSSGKSKGTDSYSWTGKQTRITYLINSHLHYSIETAMKNSLSIATGEIARGIHETARIKLNEIAANLKVGVTV